MRRSQLLTIFLVVFIDLLGFGIIIPILPYYAESFGASATGLAWILVCYSGMQFLFSPIWGRLSDHFGRRPILLTCLAGISGSLIIVGFAQSMVWLFVGRLLAGLFGANISVASAYIADITPPEKRAKGMAMIGVAFGLGFLFGPAVGGYLSVWGYGTAAFAAVALSASSFLFALAKLKEPELSEEERVTHRNRYTAKMWLETITSLQTGLPIWLFFIMTMGVAQIETSFALYLLAKFGLDALHAGMILALIAICMAAVQGGAIGFLVKNIGEPALVMVGALCMAVSMTAAVFSPSVHYFVAASLIYGIGYALVNPTLSALASKYAMKGAQGAVMGVYQSAGSMGRILGPLFAGALFDHLGIAYPFYVAAGFFILALLVISFGKNVWVGEGRVEMEVT